MTTIQGANMNATLADFPFAFGGGIRVRVIGSGALFSVERYDATGSVIWADEAFEESRLAMRHALDRAGWLVAVTEEGA